MPKKDEVVITGEAVTYKVPAPAGGVKLETFVPYTLIKRGVKREIITPLDAPEQFQQEAMVARAKHKEVKDSALVKALGLAHYWQSLLDSGKFKTLTEIAAAEDIDLGQASRVIRLSQLAAPLVKACIAGTDKNLSLANLKRRRLPLCWHIQQEYLTQ